MRKCSHPDCDEFIAQNQFECRRCERHGGPPPVWVSEAESIARMNLNNVASDLCREMIVLIDTGAFVAKEDRATEFAKKLREATGKAGG